MQAILQNPSELNRHNSRVYCLGKLHRETKQDHKFRSLKGRIFSHDLVFDLEYCEGFIGTAV